VDDFMRPDRVIVGCDSETEADLMRALYAPFLRNRDRLLVMDVRSAELTKYAANAMLAARISFMNEMARLAEPLGADIEQVRRGIGSDARIGTRFLYAGCGWGGSCLPKDLQAIACMGLDCNVELPMLDAVQRINRRQRELLVERVTARFGEDLSGHRFALWGLAFKPGTDDLREAPSRVVMEGLLRRGAQVSAFDPVAMDAARERWPAHERLHFAADPMTALDDASALLVVTEWREFRSPDFAAMRERMRHPLLTDGRNLYEPQAARDGGFEYMGIGRPAMPVAALAADTPIARAA
jgi:UDPglucose 6-dehydrogenase